MGNSVPFPNLPLPDNYRQIIHNNSKLDNVNNLKESIPSPSVNADISDADTSSVNTDDIGVNIKRKGLIQSINIPMPQVGGIIDNEDKVQKSDDHIIENLDYDDYVN